MKKVLSAGLAIGLLTLVSMPAAYADLLGVGDDVALNKDAKADQSWSIRDASKAVDGTGDFWNAGDHGAHWLEVDLGQNYSLSHVDLSFPAITGGVYFNLYYSTIDQAWNDLWSNNTNWTYIATGALKFNLSANIDFNGQSVRYLKYEVTSAGDWVGLTELAAYGPQNPVPEPATMLLFGTGLAGLAAVSRRRNKKAC